MKLTKKSAVAKAEVKATPKKSAAKNSLEDLVRILSNTQELINEAQSKIDAYGVDYIEAFYGFAEGDKILFEGSPAILEHDSARREYVYDDKHNFITKVHGYVARPFKKDGTLSGRTRVVLSKESLAPYKE